MKTSQSKATVAAFFVLAMAVAGMVQSAAAATDPFLMSQVRLAQSDARHDDAVALLERAFDASDAEDHSGRNALLDELGKALVKAGRDFDAAYVFAKLARRYNKRFGKANPESASYYEAAGAAFERAGETALAISAFKRTLAIDQPLYGNTAPSVVALYARLATLSTQAGDSTAAENYARLAAGDLKATEPETPGRTYKTTRGADDAAERAFTKVKIFYATDRARSGSLRPSDFFSGERGELSFGTAQVSIPRSHKPGVMEAPSLITFEVTESAQKHIVLHSITPLGGDKALAEMRAHLADAGSDEAFIFVHGYNVPFSWAARRTAQLAYDLNFQGLPILYSWPSRGSLLDYMADAAVVRLSGRRLSGFLEQVVASSGAKRIHLIGHSMGNQALTDALELLALRRAKVAAGPAFEQILFTAPDLDAGLFAEMIKTIRPVAKRMTLYASQKDLALIASRRVHGDAPRAGQGGTDILLAEGLDSVDMTALGSDMLGHNYFSDHASALTDMLSLFWRDAAPTSRCGMVKRSRADRSYWLFDPQACRGAVSLSALTLLKTKGREAVSFAKSMVAKLRRDGKERAAAEWSEIQTVVGALGPGSQ